MLRDDCVTLNTCVTLGSHADHVQFFTYHVPCSGSSFELGDPNQSFAVSKVGLTLD